MGVSKKEVPVAFARSAASPHRAAISSACVSASKPNRGFILVEVTVAMILVAIFAVVSFQEATQQVQIAAEEKLIGVLARSVVIYYAKTGQFPPDVRTLGAQVVPAVMDLERLTGVPNVAHWVHYDPLKGCMTVITPPSGHAASHTHSERCS